MKSLVTILALTLAASCQTPPPEPTQAAVGQPIQLQLEAHGNEMTALAFLHECQRASGRNFTFPSSIADELGATKLRVSGPARIADAEFDEFVSKTLAVVGYTCRSIGPAHLHVLEVRRAS